MPTGISCSLPFVTTRGREMQCLSKLGHDDSKRQGVKPAIFPSYEVEKHQLKFPFSNRQTCNFLPSGVIISSEAALILLGEMKWTKSSHGQCILSYWHIYINLHLLKFIRCQRLWFGGFGGWGGGGMVHQCRNSRPATAGSCMHLYKLRRKQLQH